MSGDTRSRYYVEGHVGEGEETFHTSAHRVFSALRTRYVHVSATSYPRFSVIFFLIFTLYAPIFNSLRLLGEFARVFVTIALVCIYIYIDTSILYIRMYIKMCPINYIFLTFFFFLFSFIIFIAFSFFFFPASCLPDLVIKRENEIAIASETFVVGDAHGHSRVLRSRILWHGSIYQRLFRPRRA